MPWWVKFLRACSRRCRNNSHIDNTYLQTYTEDNVQNTYTQYTQCTIRHIYSYQYTLYTLCTHIYTHNNMQRCNQIIHKPDMQCHLMVSSGSRKVVVLVQCVRVVQLNCVKVQCMAYCKVGVCSRVYYFWLFIVLIAWGEKLFLSRLVWDRMLL